MSKCLLNKNSFINIQPFMVINLDLSGVSLLIYALIYGHTVNKGVFYGSLEYIAQWCNCSTRNVTDCIKKLVEAKLIRVKRTPKGTFYMSNPVSTDLPKEEEEIIENPFFDKEEEETSEKQEKTSSEEMKKLPKKQEETSSNKLDNNLDNKLDINSNSHYAPFSPSEQSEKPRFIPQSDSLSEQSVNSNSHSVSVADSNKNKKETVSFKQEEYTQVYNIYFENCKTLFQQGKIPVEKPVVPTHIKKLIKQRFIEYGVDKILLAVKNSVNNSWLVNNAKYSITALFSDKVITDLINDTYTTSNQPVKQPYQQNLSPEEKTEKTNADFSELRKSLYEMLCEHNKIPNAHKIPVSRTEIDFSMKEFMALVRERGEEKPEVIRQSLANYIKVAESDTYISYFGWNTFLKNYMNFTPDFFNLNGYLRFGESNKNFGNGKFPQQGKQPKRNVPESQYL